MKEIKTTRKKNGYYKIEMEMDKQEQKDFIVYAIQRKLLKMEKGEDINGPDLVNEFIKDIQEGKPIDINLGKPDYEEKPKLTLKERILGIFKRKGKLNE